MAADVDPLGTETVLHLGVEKTFLFDAPVMGMKLLSVRAGGFTDPDHDSYRALDTDDTHYTFGLGTVFGERLQVDLGAEFSDRVDAVVMSGVYHLTALAPRAFEARRCRASLLCSHHGARQPPDRARPETERAERIDVRRASSGRARDRRLGTTGQRALDHRPAGIGAMRVLAQVSPPRARPAGPGTVRAHAG